MPAAPSTQNLLYHYTDINGLIGILSTNTIRATDARFLNDAQELKYGASIASDVLNEKVGKYRETPQLPFGEHDGQAIAEMLSECIKQLEYFHSFSVPFICCLSIARDLLSQWRGYGSLGYAIGFDKSLLGKCVEVVPVTGHRKPFLERVRYGDEAAGLMREAVGALIETVIEGGRSGHPGTQAHWRVEDMLADGMPLTKDPAFVEEREWRICIPQPVSMLFRPSPLGPIPYTDVSFSDDAVREIIVGPGSNMELRTAAVITMISSYYDSPWKIKVSKSGIPFRG